MLNYTNEELKGMETIEINEVFGSLKVDTDKERVYLDEQNNEINVSWFDDFNEEWTTETFNIAKVDIANRLNAIDNVHIVFMNNN